MILDARGKPIERPRPTARMVRVSSRWHDRSQHPRRSGDDTERLILRGAKR